jgi:hypothetical protein
MELRGCFVRGQGILIEGLTRQETLNAEALEEERIRVKRWQFEAADLDSGVGRALRNQRSYNKSRLDGDAIRYIYVEDSRGNRRDLFDMG